MNGSASCTTSSSPSPPSTGSPPPATSSSSKATPTAAASARPHPRLTTPPQPHHDAHVTGQVVPSSWRTPGPILLADDSFWESHQPAPLCLATASTPEQATSTPGPGS